MSEPVSNAEIEDVLSSIRRLVSNDVEATQAEVTEAAPIGEPVAKPAGKLILTADFRVSEPKEDIAEEYEAEVKDDAVPEPVEQDQATVEAPLEFHHTARGPEAEAEVEPEVEVEPAGDETNEVWQDPAESTEEITAGADDDDTSPSLEDTIADLEAAIGQQQGEWEPDGSGFEEDPDAEEVMSEPVQDWIDSTAQDLGAEAQAREAAVVADSAETDLFGDEESVIDEETLRDMVSDIVRQELQGALGERITRNVRKLVRREINRVLAAQDFD